MKEFETKILDINVPEIKNQLKEIGAKKIKEFLLKRWVFDIDNDQEEWIRLRDEDGKVMLAHKHIKGDGISEAEEIETEVKDFEKTVEILSKLPFRSQHYQETKRILYKLNEIEFTIDTWPQIPALLEIESVNEEKVKEGLALLNLEGKDVGNLSVRKIYLHYNINLNKIKELKF